MKFLEISITFVVASIVIVHGLFQPHLQTDMVMNVNDTQQMLQLHIKNDSDFLDSNVDKKVLNGQTCVCVTGEMSSFKKLKFSVLPAFYSRHTLTNEFQLRLHCKLGHCKDCRIEKSSIQHGKKHRIHNAREIFESNGVADISCKEFPNSKKIDSQKLLTRGSFIQKYTYEDYNKENKQEDKHKINVKEVYKRSCIVVIPVKWCNNQEVTTRSKHLDGNYTQNNLMNGGGKENLNITTSSNFSNTGQFEDENSTNFSNVDNFFQQLHLASPISSILVRAYDKTTNGYATKHSSLYSISNLIRKGKRSKREMDDMMSRYQEEETSKVSKRKGKGKQKAQGSSSNDKRKVTSTSTPLTLNVSFTGYTDRKFMKTTVKPRVQNPLKMTKEDMEHVHGKEEKQKKDCDDSDESESESREDYNNQKNKNRKNKDKPKNEFSKSQSKSEGWKSDWD